MPRFALTASDRSPLPGARPVGKSDPNERLEVTVLLRRRDAAALKAQVGKITSGDRSATQLTHEQFERQPGAETADIGAVKSFAEAHGLVVAHQDAARRSIMLAGTVAQFNAAFDVDLQQYEHAEGTYRGRVGAVRLPAALKGVVEAVLGLDDRPVAKPHFRRHLAQTGADRGLSRHATSVAYTPTQLASIDNFPAGDGTGRCIAII